MSDHSYGRTVAALLGAIYIVGALREVIGVPVALGIVGAFLLIGTIVTLKSGHYRTQRNAQLGSAHLTALTLLGGAAIAAPWVSGLWLVPVAAVIGMLTYGVTWHAWINRNERVRGT